MLSGNNSMDYEIFTVIDVSETILLYPYTNVPNAQ